MAGLSEICFNDAVLGACDASTTTFYYDSSSNKCLETDEGSCVTNDNTFSTIDICKTSCIVSIISILSTIHTYMYITITQRRIIGLDHASPNIMFFKNIKNIHRISRVYP